MVILTVVRNCGDKSFISCNIMLIGQNTASRSSVMALKIKDFVVATFFLIPCYVGTSFLIVALGDFICWSQKPIKIGKSPRCKLSVMA